MYLLLGFAMMKNEYDPKGEDFDAYRCWEDANCCYVEEDTFGNPGDEDFEEYLYCGAPNDYVCPLFEKLITKDLYGKK